MLGSDDFLPMLSPPAVDTLCQYGIEKKTMKLYSDHSVLYLQVQYKKEKKIEYRFFEKISNLKFVYL